MKPILLTLALVSGAAHAEFMDGNRLLEKINGGTYYEQGSAMGYIMGVADTTMGVLHCAPPNATGGQLLEMVTIHLRAFPERRTRTADSLVIDTMKSAWPCPQRQGSGRAL